MRDIRERVYKRVIYKRVYKGVCKMAGKILDTPLY